MIFLLQIIWLHEDLIKSVISNYKWMQINKISCTINA